MAGVALLLAALLVSQPPAAAQPDPDRVEAGVAPGAPVPDTRPGEAFADPKVAQLQRTASAVQRELGDLAGQIHLAEVELQKATDQLARARAEREAADATVAAQQQEVDAYSAAVFSAMSRPSGVQVLLTAANPDDFLHGSELVAAIRADQDGRLSAALRRQGAALAAERAAADAERAAG
ncbi:MAG TPA: D-alanyl-D-alanine carboxypeptidase, partial [Actinophytocola sp.]|nr:D-alanyl-D-alanine carboxypeptidase [Actinophytocola sp.]